jgi:hypothetical protein
VSLADKTLPYWQRVHAAHLENSSIQTISLACRAIFDDSNDGMTGKNFAKVKDPVLQSLAEFYGRESGQPVMDALKAVTLLRDIFKRCAHQPKQVFDASSLLERRVGLVKFHGHRAAAHITLEPFLFHTLDLVHVAAAIAMLGAMIVDFDDKTLGDRYFDAIDEAAWQAATNTFPGMSGKRLFHNFNILEHARAYWKIEELCGLNMLLNQLPAAIGYWDSTNEVPD